MQSETAIQEGDNLWTTDGENLGRVSEVLDDYFRVAAPLSLDYWLARDCITKRTHDQVVVGFRRAELKEHRQADLPSGSGTGE